jgi:signal transduction histidine kinase
MTSHELRTPVTVISGAVEILEKRNRLTEDDRKTLGRIRQTCNDMRSNTEALLLLARHTDTHVNQNHQTVITTVNHVKNELAHAREDAGLRIKLANTGKAAMYMADSALSHMLFRNLLDNALRHTGGKIRVGFTEDSVFIEDEGHGFAAINPDRDQPVQAETHATAEYGGLGLSIVTMIAEKLGWKVHIDSPSGAGNRIVIVFKP